MPLAKFEAACWADQKEVTLAVRNLSSEPPRNPVRCIHDMPDPVSVLRRMHDLIADDGVVMVMDEAVGERFGDRDDEIERLMYGLSLFVCLPDGMSHEGSVGTGTLMRPSTLRSYATDAGFSEVEVLHIENDFWRFYRLRP